MDARILLSLPLPDPFTAIAGEAARLDVIGRTPAPDELAAALADGADVLCPQLRDRVDATLLDVAGERLRAVCVYAVGYDNVDVGACTARGIAVGNTPGVLTEATADCALGLLIAAARRLREGDAVVRAGRFTGWEPEFMLGLELHSSLLGIVGFGRIGQALARRALACGMRVAYFDEAAPPVAADLVGRVEALALDELLAQADAVSLHVPLSDATHHLIDERVLRAMRETAVLVNTSRGQVIDERALVRALREGWIAGAGLDVYEAEPELAPGLAECPTAVLAPHLGSATVRTRAAMAEICARNAVAALRGELPPHCVNPEVWASGAPASLLAG